MKIHVRHISFLVSNDEEEKRQRHKKRLQLIRSAEKDDKFLEAIQERITKETQTSCAFSDNSNGNRKKKKHENF